MSQMSLSDGWVNAKFISVTDASIHLDTLSNRPSFRKKDDKFTLGCLLPKNLILVFIASATALLDSKKSLTIPCAWKGNHCIS